MSNHARPAGTAEHAPGRRRSPTAGPSAAARAHLEPVAETVRGGRHVVAGTGPVARAVVDALAALGVRPTVISRSAAALTLADHRRGDLADPAAAAELLAGADVVYQCAQPEYHRWPQEFPALQTSILDAAGRAGAVLVAVENVYGYGHVPAPMTEATPLAATTRKGRTRAEMWRQLAAAHAAGWARTVAARASDFYGPGVTASMLGERTFGPLVVGGRAEVVGDPDRLHTATYVPDLAVAMVRLGAEPDTWGRAWHVPNAPATTTRELLQIAASAAGTPLRLRTVPRWQLRLGGVVVPAARETVEMLYEFTDDHVVDHHRYADRFADGFARSATPLTDGLAATVAWYQGHAA